jgi:hypothetical protein
MAQKWRYYEGTTSSNSILQDLSKVLCLGVKDNEGKVIQERNWDIFFPDVDRNPVEKDYVPPVDKENLTPEEFEYKIKNQLRQIKDKVILKTNTTPVETEGSEIDDLGIESDLSKKSIEMFVELYKPDYLFNPEIYETETERYGVLPLLKTYDMEKFNPDDNEGTPFINKLVRNNHSIYIRAFDSIDVKQNQVTKKIIDAFPKDEVKDGYTGNILETQSHLSEWSKLSWYQDFEEVEIDQHDDDIGGENISNGVEFIPAITPGINGDTRIRFWVNSNNDRVSLIVMGNPSLEFSTNKHLVSFCYLGRIKSFENSINDTAGNFAITCSSSTLPCKTVQKINKIRVTNGTDAESTVKVGVGDGQKNRFFIPFKNSYKEGTLEIFLNGDAQNKTTYRVDCDLLEFDTRNIPNPGVEITAKAQFIIPEVDLRPGVTRDELGNVINVVQPNKYGQNTATCVTDIAMYHTRSKAYWQKHMIMFNTTEEYMTKEMYGKSAYTNEYYADKIKVTHGNDGPRGMLDASLIIDQSSLIPLDDLVVNRKFSKKSDEPEETYIYFPITAPYSLLSTGPNALSGIAILKEIKLPEPKDDAEALNRVAEDLYIGRISAITGNFNIPLKGNYDSTISWVSSDEAVINVKTGTVLNDYKEVIVTRPDEGQEGAKATLTATITINSSTKEIVFECFVFPQGLSDSQAVTTDKQWLDLAAMNGLTNLKSISFSPLKAPIEGPNETNILWKATDENGDISSLIKIPDYLKIPEGEE